MTLAAENAEPGPRSSARLAEALAEYMHKRVREEFWAYAQPAAVDNEALIREAYRGIRPAPGYPACPDHLPKQRLFTLLDARDLLETLREAGVRAGVISAGLKYTTTDDGRSLQQAMLDAWRNLPKLRDPARFDAWAYRLVVNAATREKDLAWLRRQAEPFGIKVAERAELAMLAVQGPKARELAISGEFLVG